MKQEELSYTSHILMKYETNTGFHKTIMLTIEQANDWVSCWANDRPFFAQVGKLVKGINPRSVADFEFESEQVDYFDHCAAYMNGFEENRAKRESAATSLPKADDIEVIVPAEPEPSPEPPVHTPAERKVTFKVLCKCSATYAVTLRPSTKIGSCKYCKAALFADYSAGVVTTRFGAGLLMTNRTFIDRTLELPAELLEKVLQPLVVPY